MDDKLPPAHYANQFLIQGGVYDFILEFARLDNPREPGLPPEIVSRVQMSPQHTKIVALMLLKHLAAYEHQIGIIELPGKLLQELKLNNLQHFISQVDLTE
ncbi:MAG TPA: DUF3467 domain-containing protein [Herpetosiphonaceae bacterium]